MARKYGLSLEERRLKLLEVCCGGDDMGSIADEPAVDDIPEPAVNRTDRTLDKLRKRRRKPNGT